MLVDAVRNYRDDLDPHLGKLKIMDEFGRDGIEFNHCVTSAPSTTMSISSMMTGVPAYYLSRQYYGFKYDNSFFISLPSILKSNGYKIYGLFRHPITRENLKLLFDLVDRKYYPSGVTDGKWWSNNDLNRIAKNILPDAEKPFFMFFHFNCRGDPKVSDTVKDCIELFRQNGYDDKNTIFILCSDHGYPDWRKHPEVKREEVEVQGHDLVLTDDNVLIPLILKFPGYKKMKNHHIDEVVTSLDIMPTILSILGLRPRKLNYRLYGEDLLPLMEGKRMGEFNKRAVRVDARFIFQPETKTAIRSTTHKYILYQNAGNNVEGLYDLIKDPDEKKNIISSKEASSYRDEYKRQEKEAFEFHKLYIRTKISAIVHPQKDERIFVLGKASDGFVKMLCEVLREMHASVHENPEDIVYDKVILTLDNRHGEGYSDIFKVFKRVKAHKRFMIDSDADIVEKLGRYSYLKHDIKMAWRSRHHYIRYPRAMVRHIKQFINKRKKIGKDL